MAKLFKEATPTKISFSEAAGIRRMELAAEIGYPLKHYFIKTHHGGDAIVRAICPVIEMFSKKNKSNRIETDNNRIAILNTIGIIYPEIFWYSMRHGLAHQAVQVQALRIEGSKSGIIPAYNWDQQKVAEYSNGSYAINPRLLYENVMLWLDKCQTNPPYETIEYTHMLEVIDKSSELYKEIDAVQNGEV